MKAHSIPTWPPFLALVLASLFPWACSSSSNPSSPPDTATPTSVPTHWAGYTNTPTPTITLTFTATSTGTVTQTPNGTFTATPTLTGTSTPSFTVTNTPSSTPTPTSSATSTPFTQNTPTYKGGGASVQFPNGIAAGNGHLYVAQGNEGSVHSVLVLDATGSNIQATWTGFGATPFEDPYGVAVDGNSGKVYVLDSGKLSTTGVVYVFDSAGATLTSWSSWSGGSVTAFQYPEGIAVDPSGNVYVADTGNRTVEKFSVSGVTVSHLAQWNTGVSAFSIPSAVAAVSVAGPVTNLYVVDAGPGNVQVYDGSSWTSGPSVANSDLFGIAVDPNGNVYLADSGNGWVEKFDPSNNLLTQWDGTGAPSAFLSPDGVLLFGGFVWVTDYNNGPSNSGSLGKF